MNLLYKSSYFSSYQCDQGRCFYIDFGHKQVKLTFCQLLSFRHKILRVDLAAHFDKNQNFAGIEIISLCNREHLFLFDTLQILDLKELIKTSFGVLELNSLVTA